MTLMFVSFAVATAARIPITSRITISSVNVNPHFVSEGRTPPDAESSRAVQAREAGVPSRTLE